MKNKIVIKNFCGPKMGLCESIPQDFTDDLQIALGALLRLLKKVSLSSDAANLTLRLRRDPATRRFMDGVFFDGAETCGYVGFIRGDIPNDAFDQWTAHSFNLSAIFQAHETGDPLEFLGADILPHFPNFPDEPTECLWVAGAVIEIPAGNASDGSMPQDSHARWGGGRN